MAYIKTNWEDFPSVDTPITSANLQKIEDGLAGVLDWIYPVGTIYETTSSNLDTTAKMAAHFGGTWEEYGAGRVLVAKLVDTEFDTIGETGGAKTHTLTLTELPKQIWHSGTQTGGAQITISTGTGYSARTLGTNLDQPHNNLQPYIVVYRYRRVS